MGLPLFDAKEKACRTWQAFYLYFYFTNLEKLLCQIFCEVRRQNPFDTYF